MRAFRTLPLWLALACGSEAAEPKDYVLCDGSDEVRLSLGTAGGFVSEIELFTRESSVFLRVTGKCEFLVTPKEGRDLLRGVLSAEQAQQLATALQLSELDTLRYSGGQNCLDGATSAISTAHGSAGCSCACDESAPSAVREALGATAAAYDLARSVGTPLLGAMEVITLEEDVQGATASWPFGFSIREIVITPEQLASGDFARARTLESGSAALVRQLRSEAATWSPAAHYLVDGKQYGLYAREELPPRFDPQRAPAEATYSATEH
jgi:hypothetical protein